MFFVYLFGACLSVICDMGGVTIKKGSNKTPFLFFVRLDRIISKMTLVFRTFYLISIAVDLNIS